MPVLDNPEKLGKRYGLSGKIESEISFSVALPCESLKALSEAYPSLNMERALKAAMQVGMSKAKHLCLGDLKHLVDILHNQMDHRHCLCEVVRVQYPMVDKERVSFELTRERLQIMDEQAGVACLMLGLRQIEARQ